MTTLQPESFMALKVTAVTRGPKHHFFGYYDKCPWDHTGRYLLAMQNSFMDRPPRGDDQLTLGMVDLQDNNRYLTLATTHAWNWQQGCMLQWLPSGKVIYNDRENDRFVSVILDVQSGQRQTLPRPIYTVSPDGNSAMTLNFERVHETRPGYGYAGIADPYAHEPHPNHEGIWQLDLTSGTSEQAISLEQLAGFEPLSSMNNAKHWVNHLMFNPDGSRFAFVHRWTHPDPKIGWQTRMLAANPDGSNLCCISDHEHLSHADWMNTHQILAWARRHEIGERYYLFDDHSNHLEVVGEGVLTEDGHCSFSPNRRWILTDTYPDREGYRMLILYNVPQKKRINLGRLYGPPPEDWQYRCDLHPRWSRDGNQVCIDSIHEGTRQVYTLDVKDIVLAN